MARGKWAGERLTQDEIAAKYASCAAAGGVDPARADACRALLERLDELDDVGELAAALHDAAPRMSAAVVTGAAGGLGSADRAPARRARAGRAARPRRRRRARAGVGAGRATALVADVADAGCGRGRRRAVEAQASAPCSSTTPRVYARAPLDEHPLELWDSLVAVNLRGYFLCTRALRRLDARRAARARS